MSNGNIYDPTAQVGTAIAERKYKKTQADIERRKEWAKIGRDTVWELAKAGSKFQRERMNAKMFGAKIPGLDDVSIYKRKNYDNIIEEAISKVWTKPSNFEYTSSARRYMSDLSQVGGEYGPEGSKAFQDASDALKADYPDVYGDGKNLAKKFKKHFGKAMKDKPLPKSSVKDTVSTTSSSTTASSGADSSASSTAASSLAKPMAGLQVGTGLYNLVNPKSSTAQQFGGAAQVALGANAGLQAFGVSNAWNPAGWGALAASLGASLATGGAFG